MGFNILQGGTPTQFPGGLIVGAHFVSPSGNASWVESLDQNTPCSWQTCMNNAVAGQHVYFRDGDYYIDTHGGEWDNPIMRPVNNGTLGNPITFRNYPGETPHIRKVTPAGSNAEIITALAATAFGCNTGDQYIIWDGFAGTLAANATLPGVSYAYNTNMLFIMYGAEFCTVRNFRLYGTVNGASQSGGNTAPMIIEFCTDCFVQNNEISGNVRVGMDATDNNTCGIWVFADTRTTFENNNIHDCAIAVGQKTGPNRGSLYQHNYFYDNYLYHFRIIEETGTALSCTIRENFMRDTDTFIFVEGSGATALNWLIYNNTFVRGSYGIFSYQNVIGTEIFNNIFHDVDTEVVMYDGFNPAVQNYNCYSPGAQMSRNWATDYAPLSAWQAASVFDDNSIEANPLFVNGAGDLPSDFVLQGGSPCIGSGLSGANMGVTNLALVGVQ